MRRNFETAEVIGGTRGSEPRRPCKTTMIVFGIAVSMFKSMFIMARSCFDMLVDFVFSLYWESYRQAVPDLETKHSMLSKSATQLALDIKDGKLKSEELVEACIERIKLVNPILNAMTDERFEEALKEARAVDMRVQAGLDEDDRNKLYLGVPFTCKESHAMKGTLHTLGVVARKHLRAHEDATCVRLLREAGAVALAVTNIPELNKWQETSNLIHGLTVNPYHTGRTVGGSSGGEAALTAALATPISLCSDIGGSTRMPAFYCGLFGYNPTAGTTNLKGSLLRSGEDDTMASIGFVSKNVEDLAPLTKIVAAEKAHLLKLDRYVDIKDVKFYYTETTKDLRVSSIRPELKKAMRKVISKLTEQASSTDLAPQRYYHDGFNYMFSLWRHYMTKEAEDFAGMLTDNNGQANGLVELGKKIVGMSRYTWAAILKLLDDQVLPAVDAGWAEKLAADMKEDLLEKLGENGVLLFPSAPLPAPYHYSCFLRPYNFAHWGVFNVMRMPSVQVPLGLNDDGLPLGIQIVSAPYNDALCLAVAKHLESEFGGFVPPCKIMKK